MMFETVIDTAVTRVNAKLADLPADAIARLEANATLDPTEWFVFGDKATLAHLQGKVDLDVAQRLHAIHTDFQTTATLAERIVFLQVMGELLLPT